MTDKNYKGALQDFDKALSLNPSMPAEKTLEKFLEATAPKQTARDEATTLAYAMMVYGQREELLRTGSDEEIKEWKPKYDQRLRSLAEESPLAKRILSEVFNYRV